MSFGETFSAFASLGDAYRQGRQRDALAALGAQVQTGDYTGAARGAFEAGDPGAALGLLKLGQQAQAAKEANTAFGALGAFMGGGAGNGSEALGVPRQASGSPSVPSFLDTSSPSGQFTANLFKRESNNNDFAQASSSSARGAGQFTRGTWNDLASKQPELGLTPVGSGQDGRTDRAQMVRATNALTAQNEGVLTQSGLPVTDASRYALHFLGAGGGRRLVAGVMRNPDAPAASYANPDQVAANRNVFFNRDGSPTVSDKEHAREMLSTADSPEAPTMSTRGTPCIMRNAPDRAMGVPTRMQSSRRHQGTCPPPPVVQLLSKRDDRPSVDSPSDRQNWLRMAFRTSSVA